MALLFHQAMTLLHLTGPVFPVVSFLGQHQHLIRYLSHSFLYVNLYHSFTTNVLRCQAYDQYYYVHMCVLSNFQYEGAANEGG